MSPKRKSAFVLPVKRSSAEDHHEALDLRAESKKFKAVARSAGVTPRAIEAESSSKLLACISFQDSESGKSAASGSEEQVFSGTNKQGSIRCCKGCSESFESFHQMFHHLLYTHRCTDPLERTNPAPPSNSTSFPSHSSPSSIDSSFRSFHPSALESLIKLFSPPTRTPSQVIHDKVNSNASRFLQPQTSKSNFPSPLEKHSNSSNREAQAQMERKDVLLEVVNDGHKAHKSESCRKNFHDFTSIKPCSVFRGNETNIGDESVHVATNSNININNNKNNNNSNINNNKNINNSNSSINIKHSVKTPQHSKETLTKSAQKFASTAKDKLSESKISDRSQPPESDPRIFYAHHRQNFFQPHLRNFPPHENQISMATLHAVREYHELYHRQLIDSGLFFLLPHPTPLHLPWTNTCSIHPGKLSDPSNPPSHAPLNFSSHSSYSTNHRTADLNLCSPQTPKEASSWSEKAKSNVWLMTGHGNTCFACGRSFTSKGSFRYHLSRCHVLSGISAR